MGTYMSQQHYQSLLNTTFTQEENNATTAASAAVVTTRSNRFAQQASALARLKRRLITAKRRCQATKAVGKEQQHHSAATPPPSAAAVEPNNDSVTDDANVLMKLQAITAKCQLYATISKPDYIREHEKQTKRTIAALEGLVSTAEAKLALLVKDQPAIAASDDETTKVFRRVDGEWQEQEDVSEEDTLKVDLEQLQQELHRQKGLAEMDAVMTADALKEDITRCQAWVQNKLQAAQNDMELQALIITNELIDVTLGDPEDEMEEGLRARVRAEVKRQENDCITNAAGAACVGISCYTIFMALLAGILL